MYVMNLSVCIRTASFDVTMPLSCPGFDITSVIRDFPSPQVSQSRVLHPRLDVSSGVFTAMSSSFSGISLIAALILFLAATPPVDVGAKSVIVDDAGTGIYYSEGWMRFNDCSCLVKPSDASAYNGTFHPCV